MGVPPAAPPVGTIDVIAGELSVKFTELPGWPEPFFTAIATVPGFLERPTGTASVRCPELTNPGVKGVVVVPAVHSTIDWPLTYVPPKISMTMLASPAAPEVGLMLVIAG